MVQGSAGTYRRGGPQVTIGMPVFNGERWLGAAIQSFREQTFGDFELIISDNASTDRTAQICCDHATSDARIIYTRKSENIGANRNYRAVLAPARGAYFKWASSNDICAPTFLGACIEALESAPDAVLACPATYLFVDRFSDGVAYEHDLVILDDEPAARFIAVLQRMQLNNVINGVIRTKALRSALSMRTFHGADVVLMAELALYGKFLMVPESSFYRRMSPESATRLQTWAEADRHLEPAAKGPLLWQTWRFYFRLLHAALRSAPSIQARAQAAGYCARSMTWSRRKLAADLVQAMRRWV